MDLKPKNMWRRVVDYARAEIERRSRPPDEPHSSRFSSEVSEVYRPSVAPTDATQIETTRSDAGSLRVQWSVSERELERSRALLGTDAVLCLRAVCFFAERGDVRREVQDRPGIHDRGEWEMRHPSPRVVVSIGLLAGEQFVSIAHRVT